MFKPGKVFLTLLLGATLAGAIIAQAAHAGQAIWRVSKTSGEVWVTRSGVQPIALSNDESVEPGDIVRTGRNGRVLLSRGEETILVSANSQVEIAPDTKAGFSTILQKAGSILLEVEKRNVQHFEVQTPYLAAVVKGTRFRVTVEDGSSNVEVLRGQVEVKDYRSGQFALVNPDQTARVLARGPSGLSLTGSGALSPIQQGTPSAAPRQLAPQLNELPTMPERDAETARETLSPTLPDASRTTPPKMVPDARGAFAGPERQPNKAPRASNGGASDITLSRVGGTNWSEVAIPSVVGVAVALGVGVVRRRNRVKTDKDHC
jgi:FecR protein